MFQTDDNPDYLTISHTFATLHEYMKHYSEHQIMHGIVSITEQILRGYTWRYICMTTRSTLNVLKV